MLLLEVFSVVFEDEHLVLDPNARFGSGRVVGVLQQLRDHMSRALDLLEQLMPRPSEIRVRFELIPAAGGLVAYAVKVGGPIYDGSPA